MRKRFKIPIWTLASVILLVALAYLWITQSPWLKNRIVGYLNRALEQGTSVRVDIGAITGDFISGFALHELLVTSGADTLATVRRLAVVYDLRDLLPDRRTLRQVSVESPRLFLPRDSLGSFRQLVRQGKGGQGEVTGAFDLSLQSLTVSEGSVWRLHDSVPLVDSIQAQASLAAQMGNLLLRLWPSSARTAAVGPVFLSGRVEMNDGGWRCDSVALRTASSDLTLSGTKERWHIEGRPLVLDDFEGLLHLGVSGRLNVLADVEPEWHRRRLRGGMELTGSLEGYELQDLRVRFDADSAGATFDSLAGRVATARWHGKGHFGWARKPEAWDFSGTVDGFNLERIATGVFPTDLSGAVRLVGQGLTNADLRVRGDVNLGAGHIDHVRFDHAAGQIEATVDSLVLGENFTLEAHGTQLDGGGAIAFADSLDVTANVTCDDLRLWADKVFVDSLSGRASGFIYLSGLTADPDLSGVVQAGPLRLYDLRTDDFEARFFLSRFLTARTGTVDARWGRSSTWGQPTDSIDVHGRLAGTRFEAERARWFSPLFSVQAGGRVDWSARSIPVSLYPMTIRWENQDYSVTDTMRVAIDSIGFDLADVGLEGPLGAVHLQGNLSYDTEMDLSFTADRFRFESLWRRFFPDISVTGLLAVRGQVRGTFASPRFTMEGTLTDLNYDENPFGDIRGSLSYQGRELHVDSLHLENADFRVDVSGTLPIDLSFQRVSPRVLALPVSGRLSAAGESLDRILYFFPGTVEYVHGPFSIAAAVSGTPQAPRFTGEGSLRSGTVKALEVANPLEVVVADLSLRQDTILVKRATGVIRDREKVGTVEASGLLRLLSYDLFDYSVHVAGRGVPARLEYEDFAVTTDFDLVVSGSSPPRVAGRISPSRIEDREPLSAVEATPAVDTTLWDWDMTIDMPGNYWLRNEQIEAELSADLRLLRTHGRENYLGTAEFIRGKIYLLDKVGRIQRGVLTFDDPDKPDPRLDIDVVFRIQQPRLETAGRTVSGQVVDLNLHIGGQASQPLIQPEPPYTEQDVLLLLTTNTTMGAAADTLGTGDPLADRMKFAATGLLLSEVQRVAGRKLGLETLEISSSPRPRETQITIGRYFSPHLYLYGSSPIDVGGGQEVGFEYRFGRHIFMEGNRDKNNLYRLNLHFNWDY